MLGKQWTVWGNLAICSSFIFLSNVECTNAALRQPPVAAEPPATRRLTDEDSAQQPGTETPRVSPNPDVDRAIVPNPPGVRPGPLPATPVPTVNQPRQPQSVPNLDDLAMRTRRAPSLRLASVPNMLGDFGMPYLSAFVDTNFGGSLVDLPLAGGALRTKISENNKALPMDRVYFQYNHFHNAFNVDLAIDTPGDEISSDLDRFTIGFEKTFCDKLWSVDVRMPMAVDQGDFSSPDFNVSGGSVGNLSVILKRLLAANEHSALAAGVGVNTPTGSDAQVATSFDYSIENEAIHLSPFIGALYRPNNRLFCHAFCEIDVPLNGNPLLLTGQSGPVRIGSITEQTLLQADVSVGYWLYRNRCAPLLTGLASIFEFHYTGTLNDGDIVYNGGDQFGSFLNRVDLAHLTVGLHAVLNRQTTLRIGSVFPVSELPDRAFDAEIQFSLNRYF